MPASIRVVLGTRGSELALAQASLVEKALRSAAPGFEVATQIINTRGDEHHPSDPDAGRKGLFTGEIERALLARIIDIAVHSAKDLPSESTAGLNLAAALPRAPVNDLFIGKSCSFATLPAGAIVATGSIRRRCQLLSRRSDLRIVDLKGNVPTRLRKLASNSWDGIILARAGVDRLGLLHSSATIQFEMNSFSAEVLDQESFLPAGGQGAIVLQVRDDDKRTSELAGRVNDDATLLCLRAEREFLRRLGGDCDTPVGVLATIAADSMILRAQIFESEGVPPRTARLQEVMGTNAPEALSAKLLELINGG